MTAITTENIESFRGSLLLKPGDLPFKMWDVFDLEAFEQSKSSSIVPFNTLISTKNELEDPKFLKGLKQDPRLTAFQFFTSAAQENNNKREPLTVKGPVNGKYELVDGNATAQMLMFVGWSEVPIIIS